MKPMKIAVFGASGKTGEQCVRQLLAAGHDVVALARGTLAVTNDKLRVVKGDVTSGTGVDDTIRGADGVIACLGARVLKANTVRSDSAKHIIAAMKKNDVKRLAWLSACGVGDSREQAKKASFFFGYVILPLMLSANYKDAAVAEDALRASGLEFVLVRPVGLNDDAAKGGVAALTISEKPKHAYIARADVAAFMITALTDGAWVCKAPTLAYA